MPVLLPRFEGDSQKTKLTLQLAGRWEHRVVEKLINYATTDGADANSQASVKLYGDTRHERHTPAKVLELLSTAPIETLSIGSEVSVKIRISPPLSDEPGANTVTEPVNVAGIEVVKRAATTEDHLLFWDMYRNVIEAMTERHTGGVSFFTSKIRSERCEVRLAGCAAPTDLFGEPVAPEVTHYGQMVVLSPNSVMTLGGAEHVRQQAPVHAVENVTGGMFDGGLFCLLSDTPTIDPDVLRPWRAFLKPVLPTFTRTLEPGAFEANRRTLETVGHMVGPDVVSEDFEDPAFLENLAQVEVSRHRSVTEAEAIRADPDRATRQRWRGQYSTQSPDSDRLLVRVPIPDESSQTAEYLYWLMNRNEAVPFLHVDYHPRRSGPWTVTLFCSRDETYEVKGPGRRRRLTKGRPISELIDRNPELFPGRQLFDEAEWGESRSAHINLFQILGWPIGSAFGAGFSGGLAAGYLVAELPAVEREGAAAIPANPLPEVTGYLVHSDDGVASDLSEWYLTEDENLTTSPLMGLVSLVSLCGDI